MNHLEAATFLTLTDFGISKNLTRLITQGKTFQGSGTSGYSPPEQWDGAPAHPSADIYAFGKLLVYLRTGETDRDRMHHIRPWARLVGRCTTLDPETRPSAEELIAEVDRL